MRLLSAAVALAALVVLLPVALPAMGLLALVGGIRRDKPFLRPRKRVVYDGALLMGDVLCVPVGRRNVRVFHRTRRCRQWWRMISRN